MTEEVFGSAYERGFAATMGFLLYRGARRDEAEEHAQAAWAKGWIARRQLKDASKIVSWVNSIAYRSFANQRRKAGRGAKLIEGCAGGVSAMERLSAHLDCGKLLERCEGLDRRLMHGRYVAEMEIGELALRSGLTEVAVRVRLHRCRVALRALAEGFTGRAEMPLAA